MLGGIMKWIWGSSEPKQSEEKLSQAEAVMVIEAFYLKNKKQNRKNAQVDINLNNQVNSLKTSIVQYENAANNNPRKNRKNSKKRRKKNM